MVSKSDGDTLVNDDQADADADDDLNDDDVSDDDVTDDDTADDDWVPLYPDLSIASHRGANILAPENKLPSLEITFHQGANAVEIDVRDTADGVNVAMHDNTVDRTTNGTGLVFDLTLAEIKELLIKDWMYGHIYGDLPHIAGSADGDRRTRRLGGHRHEDQRAGGSDRDRHGDGNGEQLLCLLRRYRYPRPRPRHFA